MNETLRRTATIALFLLLAMLIMVAGINVIQGHKEQERKRNEQN